MVRDTGIPSVWDLVPEDSDLYQKVFQEHFGNTNLQVIAVFKSLKVDGADKRSTQDSSSRGGAASRRSRASISAHSYESLRILVVTVDKTKQPPKAAPQLHKFGIVFSGGKLLYHPKGVPLSLTALKQIHIIDPPTNDPMITNIVGTVWGAKPRKGVALPKLPEGFLQPSDSQTPFHNAFATGSRRVAFACVLFCVSRAFAGHKPQLHGIGRDLVDAWAARTIRQRPSNIVPSNFERVAFASEQARAGQRAGDWAVLSDKDEVHLTGLLDLINQTGQLDVAVLRQRLEAEHNALEAANVQSILGSVVAVPKVIEAMKKSSARLADLDVALEVFDGKLASMREDIASIETRNSSLDTQAKNLEALKGSLMELFQMLTPSRAIRNLEHLQLKESTILTAICGLSDLKQKLKDLTPGESATSTMRKEVTRMRVVTDFKEGLQALSAHFLGRTQEHLCGVAQNTELFTTTPHIAINPRPPLLLYAPLLHLLPQMSDGDKVMKDVRAAYLTTNAATISKLVKDGAASVVNMFNQEEQDSVKVCKLLLKFLQVHLPPIAHAIMVAVDALALREQAPVRPERGETSTLGITGALTSSLTGAITRAVNKQAPSSTTPPPPRTLVEKALAQAQRTSASGAPTINLQDLLQPQTPVNEHGQMLLARVTNGGVRDAVVRVVRVCSSKSYVPLVSLYAGIAAWRKHFSMLPSLAPLNAELKEAIFEVSTALEKHQDALVAAAEKQEQPKATVLKADSKSVKTIGILHQTEVLAGHASELAMVLDQSMTRQLWWMPWGEQVEVGSSDALARKAHEPVGRIIPAVYNAILANITKLSARDTKHGPRLVLENLAALQPRITKLAEKAPDIRAVRDDLQGNLSRAMGKVVEEQLQASKLWSLLSFAGRLHVLLREVAPGEVQFQQGYSQSSVSSTVESGYSGMDKKLLAVSQRVKKHLPGSPSLLKLVWAAVEESLRNTLTKLERDLKACYKTLRAPMGWQAIEAMLKQNAPQP